MQIVFAFILHESASLNVYRLSFRLLFSFSIQHPLCWANLRMKKKTAKLSQKSGVIICLHHF